MATVKDVAREAGVSLGTVSNVLNGKGSVKPRNREKVYEAMKKLGFHYNMTASALRTKTTKNIGLILPTIINPFYPDLARGVEDEARKAGFTVFLCNSDRDKDKEQEYIEALLSKGVDGIILLKPQSGREQLTMLYERTALVVEDWENWDVYLLPSVNIDGAMGIIQGMNTLVQYGHRRIAFIAGLTESYSGRSGINVYKESLEAWKIPFRQEYIAFGDYSWKSGLSAAQKFLELDEPPTAIFASNDMMAIGAIKAIQSRGIQVPDAMSVMGIDDIEMGLLCTPALTTIHQPKYEVGAEAFRLLMREIKEGKGRGDNRQVTLGTRIVMRDSVTYARGCRDAWSI